MYSRTRPWLWAGGAQRPTIAPSSSRGRDSWRFRGASGTRREAGVKHVCTAAPGGSLRGMRKGRGRPVTSPQDRRPSWPGAGLGLVVAH